MFPPPDMPHLIGDFQPQSFRDRGAMVPFTTPILGGARVRAGARQEPELILCNPSGGRGVYILPLAALEAFCQPSLFDRALVAAIRMSPVLTPAVLRKVTRETMAGGLAGRAVQRGAAEATPRMEARRRETRAGLRNLLHRQIGSVDAAASADALAKRLGLPVDTIQAAILAMADLFADIDVSIVGHSPIVAQRTRLRGFSELVEAAAPWLTGRLVRDVAALRRNVAQFVACATMLDADIAGLLADAPSMIADFTRDPIGVADSVTRVDWLFDGWDRLRALWQAGTAVGPLPSPATLADILPQAPVLPGEALAWIGAQLPAPMPGPQPGDGVRAVIALGDLLARNEQVLATTS